MAEFITNLWEAVFTPGTTPTLLLATNATFAVLQLLLAALLFATFSIHFVILSILCGGLWWSINWFADEVRQAQEKEEEAKRIRRVQGQAREKTAKDGESADDEGGETETETEAVGKASGLASKSNEQDDALKQKILVDIQKQGQATEAGRASALHTPGEATRHRNVVTDMSASTDMSTDSEWEKVDSEK